jgi:hypothetical protein
MLEMEVRMTGRRILQVLEMKWTHYLKGKLLLRLEMEIILNQPEIGA